MVSYLDLRLIAIVTMVIDHLGFIFFPDILIFRLIGRLSFPLFTWGVAQGARFTHNWYQYALRLFVFALIAQYPYYLFSTIANGNIARLNVLFTLLLGLFSIQVYKSKLTVWVKFTLYYLLLYASVFIDSDYQSIGVLSVLFSYIFMQNLPALFVTQLFLFMSPIIVYWILGLLDSSISALNLLPFFAPFAYFFTLLPQKPTSQTRSSPLIKYLHYLLYPLQFLAIYFLKRYLFS